MWASRIGFVVGTVGGQRGISVPEAVPYCTHWYLSVVKEDGGGEEGEGGGIDRGGYAGSRREEIREDTMIPMDKETPATIDMWFCRNTKFTITITNTSPKESTQTHSISFFSYPSPFSLLPVLSSSLPSLFPLLAFSPSIHLFLPPRIPSAAQLRHHTRKGVQMPTTAMEAKIAMKVIAN